MSKLGLQTQMFEAAPGGPDDWAIDCKPKSFKIIWSAWQSDTLPAAELDRLAAAGLSLVIRPDFADPNNLINPGTWQEQNLLADPQAGAAIVLAQLKKFRDRWPHWKRYQVLNETGIDGWLPWHSEFIQALAPMMRAEGMTGVFFNAPVGNPASSLDFPAYEVDPQAWLHDLQVQWKPMSPALISIRANGHYLGLNQYAHLRPFNDPANQFTLLRHRLLFTAGIIGNADRLIIGETGLDRGDLSPTLQRGWKAHYTAQEYADELHWLNAELQKDSYVESAEIFGAFLPYGDVWKSFDVVGVSEIQAALRETAEQGDVTPMPYEYIFAFKEIADAYGRDVVGDPLEAQDDDDYDAFKNVLIPTTKGFMYYDDKVNKAYFIPGLTLPKI